MQLRRLRALSAGLALVVATVLASCSLPGVGAPPAEPDPVVDGIEFPEPVATAPGTTLAFGEPAWIPVNDDGEEHLVGVAVLDIIEGDPSFWEETFDNADEFVGYTPYFVFVQRKFLSDDGRFAPVLWPVHADLTDASIIETTNYGLGVATACGDFVVPTFGGEEDYGSPLEYVDCFVTAAQGDASVAGVRYDTTGKFTVFAPSSEPYFDAPLYWMAG